MIRPLERDSIKSVHKGSINSVQMDSRKPAKGNNTETAKCGSSVTVNGSPVTSELSDSDVLLAQRPALGHTEMSRPDRARLKENKSAKAGIDDNSINVESHSVQDHDVQAQHVTVE